MLNEIKLNNTKSHIYRVNVVDCEIVHSNHNDDGTHQQSYTNNSRSQQHHNNKSNINFESNTC